ncbi:hypothetical protein SB783_43330, partial [Paraburkholderia sp. SIMBA_009]
HLHDSAIHGRQKKNTVIVVGTVRGIEMRELANLAEREVFDRYDIGERLSEPAEKVEAVRQCVHNEKHTHLEAVGLD